MRRIIKRKKNNKIKNFLTIIQNIVIFVLVFVVLVIFYYNYSINYSSNKKEDVLFVVEKGDSVSMISENLKKASLIKSKNIFKIYVKRNNQQAFFKEGSFNLSKAMSVKEIVKTLTTNPGIKAENRLTFIEGWNLKDYSNLLIDKNITGAEDFFDFSGVPMKKNGKSKYLEQFLFLKDKPLDQSLEGYLFPDTYMFFADASVDDIVKKMLENFDKKLTKKMREDIASQGKTIHEIITMASIIQKEVRSEKDMKMVSGIFWNRIKIGQALESCATLAYILGVNKAQYSYEDTRTKSDYNTYTNRGLPPGPISNPGIKAIEAAIYPTENDFYYFLSASDSGETIFSKSYQEHLINKNKYIK